MTREEALEVFSTVKERSEHFKECGCRFPLWTITERDEEAIDMAIEALQTDVEQGEWIDVENEPYCECSVCGSYIDNLDDDYAFCPRCGAKMKGGDDE